MEKNIKSVDLYSKYVVYYSTTEGVNE